MVKYSRLPVSDYLRKLVILMLVFFSLNIIEAVKQNYPIISSGQPSHFMQQIYLIRMTFHYNMLIEKKSLLLTYLSVKVLYLEKNLPCIVGPVPVLSLCEYGLPRC